MLYPIALGMPGGAEWIIIAAIGLLLFGKRLPEVGRSLGKGIVEFKKGLKGVEDEVETASDPKAAQQPMLSSQPTQALRHQTNHKRTKQTGMPAQTIARTALSGTNPGF